MKGTSPNTETVERKASNMAQAVEVTSVEREQADDPSVSAYRVNGRVDEDGEVKGFGITYPDSPEPMAGKMFEQRLDQSMSALADALGVDVPSEDAGTDELEQIANSTTDSQTSRVDNDNSPSQETTGFSTSIEVSIEDDSLEQLESALGDHTSTVQEFSERLRAIEARMDELEKRVDDIEGTFASIGN